MKKIFISHSTKDEVGPYVVDFLESIGVKRNSIFCSSNSDTGINATKKWFDVIFEEVRKSNIVILIATPNYMRSGISLLEAGGALGTKKELIILAFPNVDLTELKNMFYGHQIVDFSLENHREIFKKCVEDNIIHKKIENNIIFNEKYDILMSRLATHRCANSNIPPIAMIKENKNIIKPCADYGIEQLSFEQIDMTERIKKAKKIKIITTTGIGLFRKYNINDYENNAFYHALMNGCEIEVLLGNPSGALFRDVEMLENRSRGTLNDEFTLVVAELSRLAQKTKKIGNGTIKIGNVDGSLRQTVILIYGEEAWGWATITLPPARCNAQSLSLELKDVGNIAMIHKYENYFDAIWKKAIDRGEVRDLSDGVIDCFCYEGEYALNKWSERQKNAKENMLAAEAKNSKILLIECSAQHPLNSDGTPGEDFKSRLNRAVKLYREYTDNGWTVNVYVPGSLHQIKNKLGTYIVDEMPLCESGKNYLISQGVKETDILGKKENDKYKAENGVYCSADECYVSSQIFLNGNYQRFIVICSPAQAMRKSLYYMLFSTLPIVLTEEPQRHQVTSSHNYAYESIIRIPEIIRTMDNMQSESCLEAIKMREERNPNYKSKN